MVGGWGSLPSGEQCPIHSCFRCPQCVDEHRIVQHRGVARTRTDSMAYVYQASALLIRETDRQLNAEET